MITGLVSSEQTPDNCTFPRENTLFSFSWQWEGGTNTSRRWESDLHYAEISHNNQGETQHDMKLTSVYDELHLPRDPPAAVDC
ncbi:hypothetical protein SKAU_G00393150 [Synaphobranchus kaupii]|uniref:Uncharacterized protein n=1 Tax=Synaphobranchus kaupii TaxID=118154 RepID=A0A9Q1IDT1_SYNKA|nr:hypothetical protein SKAU_G00393150 [Synaphobranchus kaupii]